MHNPFRKATKVIGSMALAAVMLLTPTTVFADNTARWTPPLAHQPYMAPTYNFETTFPLDQWGRPTTSNVPADRDQNVRRDRHSAHLPPPHGASSGFFSGEFPTERANPFAPLMGNNPGASHAIGTEQGFMAIVPGEPGVNVRAEGSHAGGFLAPTSVANSGNPAGTGTNAMGGAGSPAGMPTSQSSPINQPQNAGGSQATNLPQGGHDGGVTVTHRPIATQSNQNQQTTPSRTTTVTPFANGTIGTLRIPALNREAGVRAGIDLATLDNYIGHFPNTSQWDGNVALASHNRGPGSFFAGIWTLINGDRIYFETTMGTRVYEVVNIVQIAETDMNVLSHTHENTLNLITCVYNRPAMRWLVTAVQV